MDLKFVLFAALLAYVNGGILLSPATLTTYSAAPAVSSAYIHTAAPVPAVAHAAPIVSTYAAAPVAIHAPAVGASQQNVYRSLVGAQSVSTYSKAVDSAFSTVRKYDTRITNDALSVAHAIAPVSYVAPAAAPLPYAVPAVAPVVSAYSAPVVARTVAAAPIAPAAVVAHTTFTGLGANYAW